MAMDFLDTQKTFKHLKQQQDDTTMKFAERVAKREAKHDHKKWLVPKLQKLSINGMYM